MLPLDSIYIASTAQIIAYLFRYEVNFSLRLFRRYIASAFVFACYPFEACHIHNLTFIKQNITINMLTEHVKQAVICSLGYLQR